jgi:hypothetical protein
MIDIHIFIEMNFSLLTVSLFYTTIFFFQEFSTEQHYPTHTYTQAQGKKELENSEQRKKNDQ